MTNEARTSKIVAGLLAGSVVVALIVLTWLYPATIGPFAAVFIATGLVMLVRARRRGR